MFHSISRLSRKFFCSMAAIMCTASTLCASGGMPIFYNPTTSDSQSPEEDFQQDFQPIADNSYNSSQYNPYSQDEYYNNPAYVQPVPVGTGVGTGVGAAAVGAGLNEARNANDRAAAEAAALNRRQQEERGGAGGRGGEWGGRNFGGEQGRGMGERGMGERGMEGRGMEGRGMERRGGRR